MRALVVGAAGFVGSHLVSHLLERGDEVVVTTRSGSCAGFAGKSYALDIRNSEQCHEVLQSANADVIYHLAGVSFAPQAEANFEEALLANVAGTSNLVKQCKRLDKKVALVIASSADVYGRVQEDELPVTELTPTRPMNNYSLSKRMAELVVERYRRAHPNLRCVIARPFNHIGPGQNSRFVVSNFALQLAKISRGEAAPVMKVGNLTAKRDFSDVRDIVRAYALLGERGEGLYTLGSGKSYSIQVILDQLIEISGLKVDVQRDMARMRGPEVEELYCDYSKAAQEVNWSPTISLRTSLEEVYAYWCEQSDLPMVA